MSVLTRANLIGSVAVGSSGAMPVLKLTERHAHEAPEGANGAKLIRTTWTIDSFALAASPQAIGALKQTLLANLTQRGAAVVLIERADAGTPDPATRTLAAGGSANGPVAGYPRCSVEFLPDDSAGIYLAFRLTVESLAPASGLSDPVWHEFETTTSTNQSEAVSIRRSGRVRVANGSSAESWVRTNVIDPARADAATEGRRFTDLVRVGLDTAECSYEYTDDEPGPNSYDGGGIDDASVSVRESRTVTGSTTERTTGYAVGTNASTFAEAQRPTASGTRIIVRDQIGAPSVPEGRVDFEYEVRIGRVISDLFGSAVVFDYSHSISVGSGGSDIQSASRFDAAPRRWLGRREPIPARESMTLVYLNPSSIAILDQVGMQPSMDEESLSGTPDKSIGRDRDGLLVATVGYRYLFEDEPTIPNPRTIAQTLGGS